MSESSSFHSPVTARSSIAPAESVTFTDTSFSRPRKIRLRIVTRHPLPELHLLAPFSYDDPDAFAKLQRFVHSHLVSRRGASRMERVRSEELVLMMEDFEVPFDDPEILRDADVVEVHLVPQASVASARKEIEMKQEQDVEQDSDDEQEERLEIDALDAEEKDAILEASRVAALLRAGIHNMIQDDSEVAPATAGRAPADDLPRMPSFACFSPSVASKPAKPAPKASTSSAKSFPPMMPTMPIPPAGGSVGAAAAIAAFEAKRNQIQPRAVPSVPMLKQLARPSAKKRTRSDSSSSSSSSDSSSDSDSSSSSSSSSTDSADSTSDSHSDSSCAPSEHRTVSDRHRSHTTHAKESHAAGQNLVPPGSGTNRTKRRNAMRREKLRLQRQAEQLTNFEQARDRAALREAGWVQDHQPMYTVKGASHLASAPVPSSSLPPGGGSLDLPTPKIITGSSGTKRKRDRTPPPPPPPQRVNPTLDTVEQGSAPYGGEVPKRMSIRHIDCQKYYDAEVERVEAEAMCGDEHLAADRDGKKGKGKGRGKGKVRAGEKDHQDQDPTTAADFVLDYGVPQETTQPDAADDSGPRKKARVEQTQETATAKLGPSASVVANPIPSTPSHSPELSRSSLLPSEASTTCMHLLPHSAPVDAKTHPDMVWDRIKAKYTPSQLAHLLPPDGHSRWDRLGQGSALLVRQVAVHPVRKCPEMMNTVAVVTAVISQAVKVELVGPLLGKASDGGENEWDRYECDTDRWLEHDERIWWELEL